MLLPMPVLALPSAPWHMAHFALKVSAPVAWAVAIIGTASARARPTSAIFFTKVMLISFAPIGLGIYGEEINAVRDGVSTVNLRGRLFHPSFHRGRREKTRRAGDMP